MKGGISEIIKEKNKKNQMHKYKWYNDIDKLSKCKKNIFKEII